MNQVIALPKGYERCEGPESFTAKSEDAKRILEAYTKLYSYNEMLYESVTNRRRLQSKYLKQIQELYAEDFHISCITQFPQEVRGIDYLKRFGEKLISQSELPILEDESDAE